MIRSTLLGLFLLISFSAQATTYRCTESNMISIDEIGYDVLRSKTSVTIKELSDISNRLSSTSRFDSAYRVSVDMRTMLGNEVTESRTFTSIATTSDVNYEVDAIKAEGIRIYIFLDEMDQAGIEITGRNGRKEKINLICN